MTDLGTLGSHTAGWWNSTQGINPSGVVVGTSYDANGNFFGFASASGKMTKMGTLGGSWSQAYATNKKGQITGLAYTKSSIGHTYITSGPPGLTKCPSRFKGHLVTLRDLQIATFHR